MRHGQNFRNKKQKHGEGIIGVVFLKLKLSRVLLLHLF